MRDVDFDAFAALIDDTAALLARPGQPPLSATARAMYFRALQQHTLSAVRAAIDAHVKDPQRGRFFPMPADLIAQIAGLAERDGRPGAEEAWAIALRSRDEAETVIWTTEIAKAFVIARPVLDGGDEVGARMAFRESYSRLVDEARHGRTPAAWSASLGFDQERRRKAIGAAVSAGLLPMTEVPLLPAPTLDAVTRSAPPHIRQRLHEVAAQLRDAPEADGQDAIAKRETAELKAASARRVEEFNRQCAAAEAEFWLAEEGDAQEGAT